MNVLFRGRNDCERGAVQGNEGKRLGVAKIGFSDLAKVQPRLADADAARDGGVRDAGSLQVGKYPETIEFFRYGQGIAPKGPKTLPRLTIFGASGTGTS